VQRFGLVSLAAPAADSQLGCFMVLVKGHQASIAGSRGLSGSPKMRPHLDAPAPAVTLVLMRIQEPRRLRLVFAAIGVVAEGVDRCLDAVLQAEFGEDAADVGS
jgi:hypothetical protein